MSADLPLGEELAWTPVKAPERLSLHGSQVLLRPVNAERDAALEVARKAAAVRVNQAKAELEAEAAQARKVVQASVSDLASQVVRAVLPATAGGSR